MFKILMLMLMTVNFAHARNIGDILKSIFDKNEPSSPSSRPEPTYKSKDRFDACSELPVGGYRVSNTRKQGPNAANTFMGQYLLKRLSDDKFQVVFNVDFNNTSTTPTEVIRTRIDKCLEVANDYFIGRDNQRLELKVLSPEQTNLLPLDQQPIASKINILPTGDRQNAGNYNQDITCPVIVHELLHISGLVDEYQENLIAGWECRAITKKVSIMNDTYHSFKMTVPRTLTCECNQTCQKIMNSSEDARKVYLGMNVNEIMSGTELSKTVNGKIVSKCKMTTRNLGRQLLSEPDKAAVFVSEDSSSFTLESRNIWYYNNYSVTDYTCPCDDNEISCRTLKKEIKHMMAQPTVRSTCPVGAGTERETVSAADDKWMKWGAGPEVPELNGNILTFTSRPPVASLLSPNHVSRIIGGLCSDTASDYMMCAQYAYKGAKAGICQTPEVCKDAKTFLAIEGLE